MNGAFCLRVSAIALLGIVATSSFGQYITLTDGDAAVDILNDGSSNVGRADNWLMGSTDHLFQEEYFYRFGTSGAMSTLGSIGAGVGVQLLSNAAKFSYAGSGVTAEVLYLLSGASNVSDLAETVKIKNTGHETIHFELIEYDDFDLNNSAGDDFAIRNNANSISQYDADVTINSEVVTAPPATYTEVNGFPTLLNKITSATFTNLDPNQSSFQGDCTFAFQWVFDLAPGQSFIMSKDKLLVVPEPGTLAAFGGLLAIALRRRNKK